MKKYKILSKSMLKKLAKESNDSWLDGWNGDTEGSYMEAIFNDEGKAIPLGRKKHLWVRATSLKNGSILFLRKEILDKAIAKLDKAAIEQRYRDLESGKIQREEYPEDRYWDLIDVTIFKFFTKYSKDLQNSYVNLYDYILDKILSSPNKKDMK